jgi:hypothetical protein
MALAVPLSRFRSRVVGFFSLASKNMNTTTRIGAVGVILAIAALSVAAQDVKPQLVRESSLTTAETLIARLTASWTYDKLNDAATFVVIATPTKVTTTSERAVLRDIEISTNNIIGIGIETAFDVFTVLKGDRNIKTFVFHHYKLADADAEALRHNNVAFYPKLASFEPKDEKAYLLFLRVEADGRYVAVSGQTDSYMSVQQFTVDSLLHQSHRDPVSSKGALPSSDEYSAKGLQFDCMVTKTNFLVGEPVNIWCAVTNTTDSTKPLRWASESSHFGVAHDETTWFEGICR